MNFRESLGTPIETIGNFEWQQKLFIKFLIIKKQPKTIQLVGISLADVTRLLAVTRKIKDESDVYHCVLKNICHMSLFFQILVGLWCVAAALAGSMMVQSAKPAQTMRSVSKARYIKRRCRVWISAVERRLSSWASTCRPVAAFHTNFNANWGRYWGYPFFNISFLGDLRWGAVFEVHQLLVSFFWVRGSTSTTPLHLFGREIGIFLFL